jgi:hypothetical protein
MEDQTEDKKSQMSDKAIANFISKNKKLFKELNFQKKPKYLQNNLNKNKMNPESFSKSKKAKIKSLRMAKNGFETGKKKKEAKGMRKQVLEEYRLIQHNQSREKKKVARRSSQKQKPRKLKPKKKGGRFNESIRNIVSRQTMFKKKARDSKSLGERVFKMKKFDYLLNSRFDKKHKMRGTANKSNCLWLY